MINFKRDRTNYGYLLIVFLAAVLAVGLILYYQRPLLGGFVTDEYWQLPNKESPKIAPAIKSAVESEIVPILVLNFFPLTDNNKLDTSITGEVPPCYSNCSLNEVRRDVRQMTEGIIGTLERGSIYHGYKDSEAIPYLDYKIFETKEFIYPIPKSV